MPFFYTDSGSFNILEVTGSTILSGSLIVSGATNFGPTGLTGSLFGTASYADSASYALTASFAQTAVTASYFSGSVSFPDGLTVGQLTASNAQLTNIVDTTATNKILVLNTANNQIFTTASVGGGGSGTGFPFSGSAVITGSLLVSGGSVPLTVGGDIPIFQVNQGTNTVSVNFATASLNYLEIQSNNNRGYIQIAGGPVLDGFAVGSSPSQKSLTIRQAGTVDIVDTDLFRVKGTVTASAYTSSLNNQVGFFGTSSFAVSSSYATSASYVASASFDGYINFANGLVVTGSTILSGSGNSLQVTGSTVLRDNLTVNGGTLFVDATNNRVNMNGSSVITGSLVVSGSTIVTGSLSLNGNATASVNHLIIDDTTGAGGNRGVIDFTRAFASGKKTTITANIFGPALTLDSGVVRITDKFTIDNIDAFEARLNLPLTTQLTASAGIITTNISASAGITGSLAQFNPVSLKLTVGTTAPTSPAVNDLWVDTN